MRRARRSTTLAGAGLAAVLGVAAPAAALDLAQAVRLTGHDYGSQVDDVDVLAALRRIDHDGGTRVDPADEQTLLDWAAGRTAQPAAVTAASNGAMTLAEAVAFTEVNYGTAVNEVDALAALRRIGRDPGPELNGWEAEELIRWATGVRKVVDTALAQVGKPYRWGGSGPDAFDCSGLTLYAWSAAGVSLPHHSGTQAGMLPAVSRAGIVPGDLLFYRNPVGHTAIYVGGGRFVEAPRSGYTVRVTTTADERSDLVKIGRVRY